MQSIRRITPYLWFDNQAEEAAEFYAGIFKNSRIGKMSRYGEAGHEVHGQAVGTVMTVAFELDGQGFVALNGGPPEDGDEKAQQCGWLKDKYGVSWQIVPTVLSEMISDPDSEESGRATDAMLKMKKIDIDKLKRAFNGTL